METIFFDIAVITVAAGAMAYLSLLARQPIIIGYILAGVALGPWGMSVVKHVEFIDEISHVGVTLLLFLAGLVLHPRRLIVLFRQTVAVTLVSALVFAVITAAVALAWGFGRREALLVGVSLMFSSTILVIKLMPTLTLHQQRMGSMCIAILVAQDLIAVMVLFLVSGPESHLPLDGVLAPVAGGAFIALAFVLERYVLRPMMHRIEHYHEALFLVALAWALAMALVARWVGFSDEVGAFVAGVALARSPIAAFLSEGLKFFRDYFLVLFFFALGAQMDLLLLQRMLVPAALLAFCIVIIKPTVYTLLLRWSGEKLPFGREVGIRMSQSSEFSLIVALTAVEGGMIGERTSQLIQLTTILTMIVSSYATVLLFPTPLGLKRGLKQD
jgi:Kef-type K+ transport system membrane component KefB